MANFYHLPDATVNSTAIPITGRYLAHNHADDIAHAFMAAELALGVTHLVEPTLTQSARLARVNGTYAWWAQKRFAERAAIEAGEIPLVPPRLVAPKPNGRALPITAEISDAWSVAQGLVAEFGPALVFDQVIAPALA